MTLTVGKSPCSAPLAAAASLGVCAVSQVPPGASRGEAGPTCDRGFPCTRMWRQTSSSRASPDSILSCGHWNCTTQSLGLPHESCWWLIPSARCSSQNAQKTQSWSLQAPLVNWAGGGAAEGGTGDQALLFFFFFEGGGGGGGRGGGGEGGGGGGGGGERREGGGGGQPLLTANWKPERKFGGIFSMWQVWEEGNSCGAEMNVQAKPPRLKLCGNNWQVGMPSSRDANQWELQNYSLFNTTTETQGENNKEPKPSWTSWSGNNLKSETYLCCSCSHRRHGHNEIPFLSLSPPDT